MDAIADIKCDSSSKFDNKIGEVAVEHKFLVLEVEHKELCGRCHSLEQNYSDLQKFVWDLQRKQLDRTTFPM